MEILEKGMPEVHRTYEGTCRGCRSRIRFRRDEARYTDDQREGAFVSIDCPVCKAEGISNQIHVAAELSVEEHARRRSRPMAGGWL
jgi:hypothetical protein